MASPKEPVEIMILEILKDENTITADEFEQAAENIKKRLENESNEKSA